MSSSSRRDQFRSAPAQHALSAPSTDDEAGSGGGSPWVSGNRFGSGNIHVTEPMTGYSSSGGGSVTGDDTPLLHRASIQSFGASARQRFITPRDEYNSVYLSFLLLGAGFLFPWDAVINAGE
jgi:hypothetical protein